MVEAYLPILSGGDASRREIMIEFLSEEWIGKYQDIGLTFYTPDELIRSTILECLEDAVDVLAQVPTLQKTVATLVRTCHILKPEDDAYDVSHSDPLVPFSVCVSVPRKRRLADSLRVAESLVHEAMHLQLTLIERLEPLVRASSQTYFSPWKDTHRSPQGILHALYVFRVLDSFFERLLALPGWPVASIDHMHARRRRDCSPNQHDRGAQKLLRPNCCGSFFYRQAYLRSSGVKKRVGFLGNRDVLRYLARERKCEARPPGCLGSFVQPLACVSRRYAACNHHSGPSIGIFVCQSGRESCWIVGIDCYG